MAERYLAEELSNELSEAQLFTELTALDGEIVRELEARRTFHTTIGDGHYYVKLHFGVGWAEILKNLLQGRAPVLGAGNEWQALKRLHDAGVPTMTGVAFVEQGSKKEDKWYELEQTAKTQTSRLGRSLQRKLDLDETQIRIDGDVHTEVNPNCDCKYSGVAVISFPQVSGFNLQRV